MPVASHDNTVHHSRRAAAVVGCAALALLAVVGCSDDSTDTAATTTQADATTTTSGRPTPSSTTTSTTPDAETSSTTPGSGEAGTAEQEVIDRYVGYWDARAAANTGVPNPSDPGLAEFATGEQLQAVIAETQSNLDDGLAFRAADQPTEFREVRVVSIEGESAVVQECVVDDVVIFRRDTGEVVNDEVATRNVRGELTRVDGRWRLSRAELVQRWEGVGGCALDA